MPSATQRAVFAGIAAFSCVCGAFSCGTILAVDDGTSTQPDGATVPPDDGEASDVVSSEASTTPDAGTPSCRGPFVDGFEGPAPFSSWGGTFTRKQGTMTLETSQMHSGTTSLRVTTANYDDAFFLLAAVKGDCPARVEVWVRPQTTPTEDTVIVRLPFTQTDGGVRSISAALASAQLRLISGAQVVNVPGTIIVGAWNKVVLTYSQEGSAFLSLGDGTPVALKTEPGPPDLVEVGIIAAAMGSGSNDILFDDVRIE